MLGPLALGTRLRTYRQKAEPESANAVPLQVLLTAQDSSPMHVGWKDITPYRPLIGSAVLKPGRYTQVPGPNPTNGGPKIMGAGVR